MERGDVSHRGRGVYFVTVVQETHQASAALWSNKGFEFYIQFIELLSVFPQLLTVSITTHDHLSLSMAI